MSLAPPHMVHARENFEALSQPLPKCPIAAIEGLTAVKRRASQITIDSLPKAISALAVVNIGDLAVKTRNFRVEDPRVDHFRLGLPNGAGYF